MQDQAAALVGIDLQVILVKEGDYWIAQAVELDYSAYGETEAEARENFENGLYATVQDHFDEFGGLENFEGRQAPAELWVDLVKTDGAKTKRFVQVSVHPIELPVPFPFGAISYRSEAAA